MDVLNSHTHHSSKDLTIAVVEDRYGQLREVKGRGFRHINIYELMNNKKRPPRAWIEAVKDRKVLWEPARKWSGSVEALLAWRDAVHPKARVVVWDEEEGFILWDEPMTVISKKSKRKA